MILMSACVCFCVFIVVPFVITASWSVLFSVPMICQPDSLTWLPEKNLDEYKTYRLPTPEIWPNTISIEEPSTGVSTKSLCVKGDVICLKHRLWTSHRLSCVDWQGHDLCLTPLSWPAVHSVNQDGNTMRGRLGHNYWDTLTLTTETLSHILMKHSYIHYWNALTLTTETLTHTYILCKPMHAHI